jgi:uncharacterized membrane protein
MKDSTSSPISRTCVELAPHFSNANAISPDGSVIVGWTSSNGWRNVGAEPVEILPLRLASDVSNDGAVVAGRCGGFECRDQAALWSQATGLVAAGLLSDEHEFSNFNAVSGDGSVAVGWSGFAVAVFEGNLRAIWDEADGLRSLRDALATDHGIDLGGWIPVTVEAIASDGLSLAGAALAPDGRIEAFVVLLRPQCSDGATTTATAKRTLTTTPVTILKGTPSSCARCPRRASSSSS